MIINTIITFLLLFILLTIYFKKKLSVNLSGELPITLQNRSIIQREYNNYYDRIDKLKFNNFIDIPVYYINLSQSIDRENHMLEQINKYNISNTFRVEAVNGSQDKSINYFNDFINLSSSEIGCTLSHLRAIKTAYDRNEQYALIVEDDVSFLLSKLWPKPLSQFIPDAPINWNILRLLTNIDYSQYSEPYISYGQICAFTTAYIINREGMRNILDVTYLNDTFILSRNIVFYGASDVYINGIKNNIYLINPPLVTSDNRELLSTIHEEDTNDHLKTSIKVMKRYLE